MAYVLIMPRQGNTVESCIIQEWKVREGDLVKADTTVAVVETDKAAFEIPAGADGQVLKLLFTEGDDVPVLQPVAVIGAAGEDWKAAAGTAVKAALPAVSAPAESARTAEPPPSGAGENAASPRARNRAARERLSLDGITGSGPGGRVIERDVAASLAGRPPVTAAAFGAAVRSGIEGTGLGGRITAADLSSAPSGAEPYPDYSEGAVTETPVKGIRKLIADRMSASLAESAQFTLNMNASAVRLRELRSRMKVSANPALGAITVNDFILYAVSRVLPLYPYMNALKTGDMVTSYQRIHLGMAVDTSRGLMVPVIRNADCLTLARISAEARRLAAACTGGSVKPDELSGSTFTVSNLGAFGVTGFTPVLNAPEVAILGVCGIELKPVENGNGDTVFEPRIGFSLTINHQVVDGAPAARFLAALCAAVADIDLLLAGA